MTAIAQHPHRVTTAVAAVRAELAQVADASLWSMDANQTGTTLAEVQKVKAQTAELEARLLAHAETVGLAGRSGATSTANWLAHHTRTSRREAHRLARVAAGLESHEVTRAALAEGRVNLEQAEAILRGLGTLPDDLHPDLVTKAEEHLVGLARDFDAARPGSSPPSSAATPRSSTSDAPNASTPAPNASSPPSSKAAAASRDATLHPASPRCTTRHHGPRAAGPTPGTCGCSAHPTTAEPTTPSTPTNDSPTAGSASPGERRPTVTRRHRSRIEKHRLSARS